MAPEKTLTSELAESTENPAAGTNARANPGRLGAIGIVILGAAAIFLYLGGWFSPGALTPARFADAFEKADGIHSGFRRNHAKGVTVSGYFESNGNGTRLSKAVVFSPGRVPVTGRFSFGGGDPYVADAPDTVRGLGLAFSLPDGEEWRTAMVSYPIFPVKTPEEFYEIIVAQQPDPQTHKPDPARMGAFLARHPETVQAFKTIQSRPVSSGFENTTFNSLMAFRFVNSGGGSIPVRWSFVPLQPFAPANVKPADEEKKNYIFDELIAAIHQGPLQWRLMITIGQPGDVTDDASIPWPEGRERVDAGTLTLDSIESDDTSAARTINFDPSVLPAGIAPSDDPLLSARAAVYSQSFRRRAGETPMPSAITPAEVSK